MSRKKCERTWKFYCFRIKAHSHCDCNDNGIQFFPSRMLISLKLHTVTINNFNGHRIITNGFCTQLGQQVLIYVLKKVPLPNEVFFIIVILHLRLVLNISLDIAHHWTNWLHLMHPLLYVEMP